MKIGKKVLTPNFTLHISARNEGKTFFFEEKEK